MNITRTHSDQFSVSVGETDLCFAAAHFITFGHAGREPLHGHNYRLRVIATGRLNESGYVFDFVTLRSLAREVIAPLNHKVLLPASNPRIQVEETRDGDDGNPVVVARCDGDRYLFPRADVCVLPLANTTAELLAVHIARKLAGLLGRAWGAEVQQLRVEVEEAPGQAASCTLVPDVGSAAPSPADEPE